MKTDDPQKINNFFKIWFDYYNGSAKAAAFIGLSLYLGKDLRQSIDAFRFLLEATDRGETIARKCLENSLYKGETAPSSNSSEKAVSPEKQI